MRELWHKTLYVVGFIIGFFEFFLWKLTGWKAKGRKEVEMINVVIIMWQGLIEDVKAFWDEAAAFAFFKDETGVHWQEFVERKDTEDTETILSDYAGSNIYETELR